MAPLKPRPGGAVLSLLIVATATQSSGQQLPDSPPVRLSHESAQTVERSTTSGPLFDLSYDQRVWVTIGTSGAVSGRLRSWTDSTLEWSGPNGLVRTPVSALRRVEVRDPVTDGAWKGALGGLAVGGTIGLVLSMTSSCPRECGPGYSRRRDVTATAVGLGAFSAAGGTVLGTLTDLLLHRRRVAFEQPPHTRIDVLPSAGAALGTALRVSW